MHRHINYHLVLALFCILPTIHGFWWSSDNGARSVAKRDYIPESYLSLLGRGDEPEDEDDEDVPSGLGECVPLCILKKEPRIADEAQIKRSDVLSDNSCLRRSSPCSGIPRDSSSNSTHQFKKRATRKPKPLPGWGSDDDLRKKDQAELDNWIMKRMPDPNEVGMPPDVDMLWDQYNNHQYIELKAEKAPQDSMAWAIPTSFFTNPGDEAFAWGTIGLVGCTVFTVVKEPSEEDPSSGVYMAHIWETPGFSNYVEPARPAIPATETEPEQKAVPKKTWILAQKTAYIKNFISGGFPRANYAKWLPPHRRSPEHETTDFQEGLNTYADQLQNAVVYVMHPRKYEFSHENDDGPDTYEIGTGPQHPDGLELLHKTVKEVMGKDKVTFMPDFLYIPAREDEPRTRAWETPSGRSLFEYDPKFDLGDGRTARMGMLLYEDGGEKEGGPDENGIYPPGPGGPFWFNFGINDPDAMDID